MTTFPGSAAEWDGALKVAAVIAAGIVVLAVADRVRRRLRLRRWRKRRERYWMGNGWDE